MGEVYEAEDAELGGRVALKTVRPHLLADPLSLNRFRREIQVARQVTHPHVCRVYDVGRDMYQDQELVYFTMEFLDGETLTNWVSMTGVGTETMLPVCRQIAEGLDALHAQGIVHRDLKPDNVMMVQSTAGVRAVIGDFGLARAAGSELATFTQTLGIVGTPAYMAPEVLAGQPATEASDLWAFGLLLHEVATGRRVAFGQNVDPSLPPNWIAAIQHCLCMQPAERPKSAAAVLLELTAPPAKRLSRRTWIAIATGLIAAGLAVAAWLTFPLLRARLPKTVTPTAASGNAEGVRDLLAHSYKPGNVSAAILQLEHAVIARTDSAYDHGELGYAYWLRFAEKQDPKDLDLARQQSERALAIDAALTQAHLTEVLLYVQSGNTELAQAQLQEAFSLDRNNPAAYAAQAALLRAQGRPSEAEAPLQRAIDLAPDDWRWPNQLGALYRLLGQFDKAASQFEASLKLAPDNAGALGSLAGVFLQQGRYAQAQQTFEKAIAADPQYRFYSGLGATLMLEGNYPEATRMFRKALDLNPRSYIAWANIGSAYSWTPGDKSQAPGAYKEAIRLAEAERVMRPKDATLLSRLGDYYAAIGDAVRAVPLLRQAVALQQDSPEVVYTAAEAYEILHRRDDALRWMKEAIKLGYPISYIERSPELAGLRADPRFPKNNDLKRQ
jgi:tetratricopeptide (TPR) repeat protein